jgi:hypothetical protein
MLKGNCITRQMNTVSRLTPIFVEEEALFQNTYKSWKEQKYGHGSRRNPKSRLTVLARPSNNLPDQPTDRQMSRD